MSGFERTDNPPGQEKVCSGLAAGLRALFVFVTAVQTVQLYTRYMRASKFGRIVVARVATLFLDPGYAWCLTRLSTRFSPVHVSVLRE